MAQTEAKKRISPPQDLKQAAYLTTGLLNSALNAFAHLNFSIAMAVLKEDNPVYQKVQALVQKLVLGIIEEPHMISFYVELISPSQVARAHC